MADARGPVQLPTARALLEFEQLDETLFRARCNLDNLTGITFGGQALGQSLKAAQLVSPGWPASSISGYFLRGGDPDRPMDFAVERVHDGRRFATRRVLARQDGRPVFDALCSFHDPEPSVSHQFVRPPPAPDPETLPTLQQLARSGDHRMPAGMAAIFRQSFPIEIRPLDPGGLLAMPAAAKRAFWFRMPSATEVTSAADHQALLALMSDYWLPGAIAAPHQGTRTMRSLASLNHALWLHAPARADDWLLYSIDSHWAAHSRGLAQGLIYDRGGTLVATAMQEALVRWSPVPDETPYGS